MNDRDRFVHRPSDLHLLVRDALARGDETALAALVAAQPADHRDAVLTLLTIHDLHLAPLAEVGEAVRFQHHPAVAELKTRLEAAFVGRLEQAESARSWPVGLDPAGAVRALAADDRVPAIYDWLADRAAAPQVRDFLALEGGPDGGFDDLVAICQVGLAGSPKVELAQNYWDEMGQGRPADVHTEMYRRFVRAVDLPLVPRDELPTTALDRALLGSLLATNRRFQPEMIGALGLIELQAGPRCRRVVRALGRVGFGEDATAFYTEHAIADPRHGQAWLQEVVAPLGADRFWGPGIVRGARWRWLVNDRFFAQLAQLAQFAGLADLAPAVSTQRSAA